MKKNLIYLSISLTSIVLLVISCRKDHNSAATNPGKDTTQNTLSVNVARKYFYKVLRKQTQSPLAVASTTSAKNQKIYPYWNHAYSSHTKLFDFVEMPVISVHQQRSVRTLAADGNPDAAQTKAVLAASFTRLVVYKNKAGVTNQRLITFIPDYDYLKKHNNDISHNHIDKLDNDFSGILEYRNWNNILLFVLRLKNGVVTRHIIPGVKINTPQVQNSGTSGLKTNDDNCTTYLVTDWEQDCVDFSDPDNPASPVTTVCGDWYIAGTHYETECTSVDCSDPANFGNAECGGDGGGSTGQLIHQDVDLTDEETVYVEQDEGSDVVVAANSHIIVQSNPKKTADAFNAVKIQYRYHAEIVSSEETGLITEVIMYPITASPMSALYTDSHGRYCTRVLTIITIPSDNTYSLLTPTSAYLSWHCDVNARYTYSNGTPSFTRQWPHGYSVVRNV
jgi:hypothetical protein